MPGNLSKHLNILDFALSSLGRRKGKNLALLAVYTLVVFLTASLIFFTQALKREAALILEHAPDMVVQRLVAGRHDPIPVARAAEIAALRGVRQVVPRLWGYYFDPLSGANFTVMAADEGSLPPGATRIGRGVARVLRIEAGHLITLRGYDNLPLLLDVQEVLAADSELVSSDLLVVTPEDFRTLFNFPEGQATDLAVLAGNPRELTTIAGKIAERFPDARPILKSEILRTYDSIFDWRSGLLVVVLAVAGLAFVIFAWDKATGLSAEEKREIGILKSLGWETADVLLLKFWEGCAVSLSAFLLGVILAYAHVFFFTASLFDGALKGWSVLYPSYRLIPALDAYQVGVLFFLTVIPYAVATLVPSWRAATVDPDAAMRGGS
jgi:ABC-type lipoprotein release transport system permease subunit